MFFTITFAVVAFILIVQEFTILALASRINSLSMRLHNLMCTLTARHKASLSVRERQRLLQLMEEVGSEEGLLSLHTLDGQRYTTETFVTFVIDTAIHYTLIVTFGYFFKCT